MRVGIGVVCIGEAYLSEFARTFQPSVAAYAQRHGYDLVVFPNFLDATHAHPDCISFQKCLVPEAMSEYDLVIVMDADIWMSSTAPPIPDPGDAIAIVDEAAQTGYASASFTSDPTEYYALAGLTLETRTILNTGFFVCRPAKRAKWLREVYDTYIGGAQGHPRRFHYEQACIGYELQRQSAYSVLANAWNTIYIIQPRPSDVYGLHFAGLGSEGRARALQTHLSAQLPQRLLRWGIRK